MRFSEIIGQKIAVHLIKTALAKEKLSRTIILHGFSGIGKTTIARLIAASFVCANKSEDNDLCGKCDMCKNVQNGSIADIIEFDAASNTSIEDIREILEQTNYAPQIGTQKIFIIDEAHMLSKNAISALLKTFEETSNHVRFILATTEIEKIPSAIRSRCFCIPLQIIEQNEMEAYLNQVAQSNQCTITTESAKLIQALSNGSMREALSILEQAMIINNNIDLPLLNSLISFAQTDSIDELANLIIQGDFVKVFEQLNAMIAKNISALSILTQLIYKFRNDFAITTQRAKILKILIDLNKLNQEINKNSCFTEMILIGLAEITYTNIKL